jgi:hypothetical protein
MVGTDAAIRGKANSTGKGCLGSIPAASFPLNECPLSAHRRQRSLSRSDPRSCSSRAFGDVGLPLVTRPSLTGNSALIGTPVSEGSRGSSCEGFRMPAQSQTIGRHCGPASESLQGRNPRGLGGRFGLYGDLMVRRPRRGQRGPARLTADRRSGSRICRRCCRRRGDFDMLGGMRSSFGSTGATVVRRRKQASPAGGWRCGEVVTMVMASRS